MSWFYNLYIGSKYMRPSFICTATSAIVGTIATIFFIYATIRKDHNMMIMSLATVVIVIMWELHCISHYLEEWIYGYNPLRSLSIIPSDIPIR